MDNPLLRGALVAEQDMVVRIPHLGLVRARTRRIGHRGMSFASRCELFAPHVRVWMSLTPNPDRPFDVLDIPGFVQAIDENEIVVAFDEELDERTRGRLVDFLGYVEPDLAWGQVS